VRLQVVGDRVVAAMLRQSATDFRANVSAGGHMSPFSPPASFVDLAVRAARAVGADFAGVDLLFGAGEQPMVCEVNSNAHMRNIEQCTGVDVPAAIADHIAHCLEAKHAGNAN
jgi:glutathione synthase/RimK-type ligase-like ATP-grasp enzyme